jgi:hypothetical protein
MPRYDLNGNELPDDSPPASASTATQPVQQYDLAGNPLPTSQSSSPQTPPQPPYGQPGQPPVTPSYAPGPPPQRKPSTYFDGQQYRFTDEKPQSAAAQATKLGIASAIGLSVSILGSIGVMKIAFYVGFGFSILYIALGWAVGFVLGMATPKKLAAIGFASLTLAIGLFVGHLTFTADAIHKYPELLGGVPLMTAFPQVMGLFKGTHWLFVLLAFAACLRGAASDYGDNS